MRSRWPWLSALLLLLIAAGWLINWGVDPNEDRPEFFTATSGQPQDLEDSVNRSISELTQQENLEGAIGSVGTPNEPGASHQRGPLSPGLPQLALRFQAPDGSLVQASAYLCRMTPEFQQEIAVQGSLGFDLWGEFALSRTPEPVAITRTLSMGLVLQPDSDFLTIFADGFAPELRRLNVLPSAGPDGVITVTLEPVKPINIKVTDSEGIPIPGGKAFLWFEPEDLESWRLGDDPRWAKLRNHFVLLHANVDDAGFCTFKSPFLRGNRIEVRPPGQFLNGAFSSVEAGAELLHKAALGLSISGRVLGGDGTPLSGAGIAAYSDAISSETRSISRTTEEGGTFLLEGVPANAQRLILTAEKAGFANAQKVWLNGKPGEILSAELTLELGVGGGLQLKTPDGSPVGPAWVWLGQRRGEGLTFGSEVDEAGMVILPPVYRKDEDYSVTLRLGSTSWELTGQIRPDRDRVIEIRDVMRFEAFRVGETSKRMPTQLRWIPERPDVSGFTSWDPTTSSPLLVSGFGVLEFLYEDYTLEVLRGHFAAGDTHQLPQPETPSSELRFSFEAGLDVAWEVLTQDGFLVASGIGDTAEVLVPCHPGAYRLIFWDDESVFDRSSLWIGENGLDLGRLGFGGHAEGSVYGQILHADGRPWPGFQVTAKLPAGSTILEVETDEDGSFQLAGLPPGAIGLEGSAQASFGISGVDFLRMIEVVPGTDVGPVVIRVNLDSRLVGELGWDEPGPTEAFLLHGGINYSRVDASGQFMLPLPSIDSWVGAAVAEAHGLSVYLQPLLSGETRCTLREDTDVRTIVLVDPSGVPIEGVGVRLSVGGQLLPGKTLSDFNGRVELGMPDLPNLKCLFFQPGCPTFVLPAREIPASGTVVIESQELDRPLLFPDEDGTPRMDVLVLRNGGLDRFGPNADGVVLVPTSKNGDWRAVSPRTFSVHLDGDQTGSVVLPQRINGMQVFAEDEVSALRFVATATGFPSIIVEGVVQRGEGGVFLLPVIPSGELVLEGFDSQGGEKGVVAYSVDASVRLELKFP